MLFVRASLATLARPRASLQQMDCIRWEKKRGDGDGQRRPALDTLFCMGCVFQDKQHTQQVLQRLGLTFDGCGDGFSDSFFSEEVLSFSRSWSCLTKEQGNVNSKYSYNYVAVSLACVDFKCCAITYFSLINSFFQSPLHNDNHYVPIFSLSLSLSLSSSHAPLLIYVANSPASQV